MATEAYRNPMNKSCQNLDMGRGARHDPKTICWAHVNSNIKCPLPALYKVPGRSMYAPARQPYTLVPGCRNPTCHFNKRVNIASPIHQVPGWTMLLHAAVLYEVPERPKCMYSLLTSNKCTLPALYTVPGRSMQHPRQPYTMRLNEAKLCPFICLAIVPGCRNVYVLFFLHSFDHPFSNHDG